MDVFDYAVYKAQAGEASEGIVPVGTIRITENQQGLDISQYAEADIDVNTDPDIGFVLEGWNEKGSPSTIRTCGFEVIPGWYLYWFSGDGVSTSRDYFYNKLRNLIINEGVVQIKNYAFREMKSIQRVLFPSTITNIAGWAFSGDTEITEYDFSAATAVPMLDNPSQMKHAPGCVIRVPSALLTEWQNSTNWCDLTDVVWEGV